MRFTTQARIDDRHFAMGDGAPCFGQDPFVDEARILSRAHMSGMIDPAGKRIVVYRSAATFEPNEKAPASIDMISN